MDTTTNEDNGQWHEVSAFKRIGRIGGGGLVSGKFIVFFLNFVLWCEHGKHKIALRTW